VVGVIDTILTTIAAMSEEDKKDALVQTGKIAEAAYNKRTEVMEHQAEEANSKLEEFVRTYQEKVNSQKQNDTEK
jgi:hypothetical protein